MPPVTRRRRSTAVDEPPSPDVVARYERDLRTVMRRSRARHEVAAAADVERDRVIRDAHAAGLGPTHIAEVTGLSNKRIEQISSSRP